MNSSRVLITGVNGFIGQHMAHHLLSQGIEVVGTGRQSPSRLQHPNFEYHSCNLLNQTQIDLLLSKNNIDYIIHLAAENNATKSWESPVHVLETNVGGTMKLLDSIRRISKNRIKGILVTGSAHEYQISNLSAENCLTEQTPLYPKSPYAWSKMLQTKTVQMYAQLYDLPVITARTFNLVGPGVSNGVCSNLAKKVIEIERGTHPPELAMGNVSVKRDFLDVRDAVRAYWLLLRRGYILPGEVFNVCSGKSYPLKTIVSLLKRYSTVEFTTVQNPDLYRENDPLEIRGENSKVCSETGWIPQLTIEKSVHDMVLYYRGHLS
jgi:GDP-4-dehydro-6-deoxy-D-mannose reductase